MNRLFLLTGCIVLWSSAVVAQDLIFEHGFENDPDAVGILTLTANPASIYEDGSTTISWTLKDAASCAATDGTAEWHAQLFEIPVGESVVPDGSFEVTTLTTAGVYSFTLTCTGSVGDPPTDTKTIEIVVSVAPPVQILSFAATPNLIEEGESMTLSWTLQDAVSCTTSGGTPQWAALTISSADSSVQITDLDTAGIYQFGLSCAGVAGDSVADIAEVTVENVTCQASTLDAGINKVWLGFWGENFPGSSEPAVTQPINTGHYLSVQFDTGNVMNNGRFLTIDYPPFTIGTRLATVSRCIGDFEESAECKHTWVAQQADSNGIDWATDGKAGACVLKPNTTYFFNVTFTDGVSSNTDSCSTQDCFVSVQHELDPVNP